MILFLFFKNAHTFSSFCFSVFSEFSGSKRADGLFRAIWDPHRPESLGRKDRIRHRRHEGPPTYSPKEGKYLS